MHFVQTLLVKPVVNFSMTQMGVRTFSSSHYPEFRHFSDQKVYSESLSNARKISDLPDTQVNEKLNAVTIATLDPVVGYPCIRIFSDQTEVKQGKLKEEQVTQLAQHYGSDPYEDGSIRGTSPNHENDHPKAQIGLLREKFEMGHTALNGEDSVWTGKTVEPSYELYVTFSSEKIE
jgi:hypothetical protein